MLLRRLPVRTIWFLGSCVSGSPSIGISSPFRAVWFLGFQYTFPSKQKGQKPCLLIVNNKGQLKGSVFRTQFFIHACETWFKTSYAIWATHHPEDTNVRTSQITHTVGVTGLPGLITLGRTSGVRTQGLPLLFLSSSLNSLPVLLSSFHIPSVVRCCLCESESSICSTLRLGAGRVRQSNGLRSKDSPPTTLPSLFTHRQQLCFWEFK